MKKTKQAKTLAAAPPTAAKTKVKVKLLQVDVLTLAVLLLTIVGFGIRMVNLDFLTIWVDEFVHVNRARFFPSQPLFTNDNNGILYTIFTIPFFKFFAVNEFWARFPSVVFGTLSIPLLYLFGKKYFNKHVGFFAAVVLTFSQYHVFWSRISRNYAIFLFFFLCFAYCLGKCLNVKNDFRPTGKKLWDYLRLTPRNALICIGLMALSLLSHQLTFMAIYAIGFYHFALFVASLFQKSRTFLSVNAVVAYLFAAYSLVLFIPVFQGVAKSILALFLPEAVVNWVIPNFERLMQLTREKPFAVFNIYCGVLRVDQSKLYVLGLIGLLWGVVRFRRKGFFNLCLFAVPFLLMSFLFREPSLPRYLIYVYPFFLLGIGIAFYELIFWFNRYVKSKAAQSVALATCIVAIISLSPVKRTWAMVQSKEHGRVVPNELSNWYFPDWKFALKKIRPQLKDSDMVMSTMVAYPELYLDRSDVLWFRQRHYDVATHGYVNNEPDTTTQNAYSLEAVVRLYNAHERGWLFGDYYLTNVMTDPRARDFIIRNADFMYALSNEYVKVFHWDKTQGKRYTNGMAELLTQSASATFEYSMDLPDLAGKKVEIVVEAEGVRYDNELLVQLNGTNLGVLLKAARTPNTGGKQSFAVDAPNNVLKVGENKIRFVYNTNEYRYNKSAKVAVYNLSLQWR